MRAIDSLKALIDRFDGMRKLLLCLVLSVVAGVPLLLAGYISGTDWKDVAVAAIAGYTAGNTAERLIAVADTHLSRKSRTQPAPLDQDK